MTDEVNEKSTSYLSVTFKDKAGAAAAPASATYRIDCLTTGTAIKADTALAPAGSVEITITPTENRIVTSGNARERRRVTVTANYGASDSVSEQYDYDVVDLSHVT